MRDGGDVLREPDIEAHGIIDDSLICEEGDLLDKRDLYDYVEKNGEVWSDLSDKIWDHAETAFEEFQSAALIEETLRRYGFEVESGVGGIETAFVGTYGSGGPVIGVLAEYDALSGMSQRAGVAVREELTPGGNGHGCGHNLFAGGSVAAAAAVAKYLEENGLPGTVKLFGCPGEEGGSGKAFMARAGVFGGLDAAFAWHPMAVNAMFDMSTLANYQVLYRFKGVASHAAAAPHKGRSALDAVELMNVGANYLREHVIQEARFHYAVTDAGGFSPNVVQPHAQVLYLIRAPRTPQVEEIYRRINKIAQGAALMTETEVEIEFIKACANTIPNKTLSRILYDNFIDQKLPEYTEAERKLASDIAGTVPKGTNELERYLKAHPDDLRKYVKELEGKDLCDVVLPFYENDPDNLLPGSSDVGDVSWNVPTAQIVTACYAMGTPEHSWQLVSQDRTSIGHKGMLLAGKVMAGAVVDVMERPEVLKAAKEELTFRLAGDVYQSAIPDGVKPRPISKL